MRGRCEQVLSYSFVNVTAVERQGKRLKWEQKPPWLVCILKKMESILNLKWWKHGVAAVIVLGESRGDPMRSADATRW